MNKYFLYCFSAEPTDGCQSTNEEDILCPLDQDMMDSLCPLNIETGLREDPLVRVNDPNLSDSERQMLLSLLPKQSVPPSPDVDDETKLMFCKLRSLQTPSELSAFRDSIHSWLDSQSTSDSVETSGDSGDLTTETSDVSSETSGE